MLDGHIRLLYAIFGAPPEALRCRFCLCEIDAPIKGNGNVCCDCLRAQSCWRAALYYDLHSDRVKQYAKNSRLKDPRKAVAWAMAKVEHPTRQECAVNGCMGLGVRHHPDYSRYKEILWLCPLHHKQLHQQIVKLGTEGSKCFGEGL